MPKWIFQKISGDQQGVSYKKRTMRTSLFSCGIFTGRKSEPFWGKLWHVIAPWVSTKCQEIERGDIDWVYEHWLSSYGPATALILTHKIPLIKIQARKICHWIFLNKLLFVETIFYFTYKADGRSENRCNVVGIICPLVGKGLKW